MKFQPLGDIVLVERLPEETKTEGGLYIATGYEKKASEGFVRAKGTEVSDRIKVGDRVLFAKYSGSDFFIDEKDHLLLAEENIQGKIIEG